VYLHAANKLSFFKADVRMLPGPQLNMSLLSHHFHVPHERNSSYVGREDIIQSLEKKLCSADAMANSKMMVLYGHAGMG
jgi:hypothetical protein